MKVLYGPPGTGKTYRAAREAVRIIEGRVPGDSTTFRETHDRLVDQGRIHWVTFHPSYAYEDFVEGFRPDITPAGDLCYRVVDGPFKLACAACRSWLRVGDRIGGSDRYEVVSIDGGGVVLRSENARSDAVVPTIEQYADFWTINRLRQRGVEPEQLSLAGGRNDERQEVSRLTNLPTTLLTNSSHLRAVYEAIEDDQGQEQAVVLVIDEINRGDLSRVFGELITLLELDKREGAPEAASVTLPYSKSRFSVPAGLSVVGTMNTADKSLSVFDLALRRRFVFEEVPPDPDLCPDNYGGVSVSTVLSGMNRRISILLSSDLRLGHADLMEQTLEALRTAAGWSTSDGPARAVAAMLRRKVIPLLQEYFHGDWSRTDFVTGGGLLVFEPVSADITSQGEGAGLDLTDAQSVHLADWWDPEGPAWDRDRFTSALAPLAD